MYQNYIFDLYGTLADTHTNENKYYLWNKLSAFYSSYGAIYTPGEFKKVYWKYVHSEEEKLQNPYGEIDLGIVFSQLFLDKGITPDTALIESVGKIMRILSRDYIKLYDVCQWYVKLFFLFTLLLIIYHLSLTRLSISKKSNIVNTPI